jgi:hypothetical protein
MQRECEPPITRVSNQERFAVSDTIQRRAAAFIADFGVARQQRCTARIETAQLEADLGVHLRSLNSHDQGA